MAEITKITTRVTDAQDKLLHQFKIAASSPNLKDFIGAIAEESQELENTFFSLIVDRYLDNATGKTLEMIGEHVGKSRSVTGPDSTDDNIYRALIKAKIAENTSDSMIIEIFQLLKIFGATNIYSKDIGSATLQLNVHGDLIIALSYIKDAVENATSPISLDISTFTDNWFGFAGDSRAKGFGIGEIGGTT